MEKQYYIASGKDHLGPFTLSQMKDKKLNPETLIWYEGLAQWAKAEDLEELKEAIPVIVSPPLTPIQVETVEKKVKKLILMKLLGRSVKYAGIVFLIVFVLHGIVQYIALDKQASMSSEYSYNNYNSYYSNYNRMSSDDVLPTATTSALMMAFIISLVSLPVFYFIEKQKPCKNLLACKDRTEEDIYQRLIENQEEKYIYDKKLSSVSFVIGCIILGLNFLFGIFPEYKVLQDLEGDEVIILMFIALSVRVIAASYVAHFSQEKSRSLLWSLLTLISPAIGLMITGSLYPVRKENTDKIVDKGEGYLSTSGSIEETQESDEEETN